MRVWREARRLFQLRVAVEEVVIFRGPYERGARLEQGEELGEVVAVDEVERAFLVSLSFLLDRKISFHLQIQISHRSSSPALRTTSPNTKSAHISPNTVRYDLSSVHIGRTALFLTMPQGRGQKRRRKLVKAKQ